MSNYNYNGVKAGAKDALIKGVIIALIIVAVGFLLYSTILQFVFADLNRISDTANAIDEIISVDRIYY